MFNGGNKMALALKAIDVSVVCSVSRRTSKFTLLSPIKVLRCKSGSVDTQRGKKHCEVQNTQAKRVEYYLAALQRDERN